MTFINRAVRLILGDVTIGALDYFRNSERGVAWGGPFNGQEGRQALFRELIDRCGPSVILETGSYLGTTTEFMAESGLPIYSIEYSARNYGFSRARLWRRRNVRLRRGDSRAVLRTLFAGPLRTARSGSLFAYLDAHWNADLPLAEELDIVFGQCPGGVVMIDDFAVPFDPGYSFDDYGPTKTLNFEYIAPMVRKYGLCVLYPARPAAEESGLRRGCVVLARDDAHGRTLRSMSILRAAETSEAAALA